MTIIFNASRRSSSSSSLAHPPLIKTPLVGRASPLIASEATRVVFVHFQASALLIATTLFIIAPYALSLAAKRFPQLAVEAIFSSRGLTP